MVAGSLIVLKDNFTPKKRRQKAVAADFQMGAGPWITFTDSRRTEAFKQYASCFPVLFGSEDGVATVLLPEGHPVIRMKPSFGECWSRMSAREIFTRVPFHLEGSSRSAVRSVRRWLWVRTCKTLAQIQACQCATTARILTGPIKPDSSSGVSALKGR